MDFSWQVLITVFTFGGIGAVVRALVLQILLIPTVVLFPIGVLFINIIAAFIGGFIIAMALPQDLHLALVTGLVGGMGTLSSFTSDVLNVITDRRERPRYLIIIACYFLATTIIGTVSAMGGMGLGNFLHGQVIDAATPYLPTEFSPEHMEDLIHAHEQDLMDSGSTSPLPDQATAAGTSAAETAAPDAPIATSAAPDSVTEVEAAAEAATAADESRNQEGEK